MQMPHTQKRIVLTEKCSSVLIQPFAFQFTLRVSRIIIVLISYARLFDWRIDV